MELVDNQVWLMVPFLFHCYSYEDQVGAPITKTPNEIMSLIFRQLIPPLFTQIPFPTLHDWLDTLTIFLNVNTSWRNIATSDPLLWKRLDLDNTNTYIVTRLAIPLLRRWIENMPIDNLHLYVNTPYSLESSEQVFNLYNVLDTSTRLVQLQIIIRHSFPQHHLHVLTGIELPNLGSLTIRESELMGSFSTRLPMVLRAPRLQELTLDSVLPRTILHRDTLRQITKLNMDINTDHLHTYHDALNACTQLMECSIAISQKIRRRVPNTPDNVITLPCLIRLSIELNPAMVSLLSNVDAPALHELNISICLGAQVKAVSLMPFICTCVAIQHIALKGVNVTKEQEMFERDIRSTHPDVFVTWKDAEKIPRIIYQDTYISGSDTEPDFTQHPLNWEEMVVETESENE